MNTANQTIWGSTFVRADAGRRQTAESGAALVSLDWARSQSLLNQLDTLEDIFYNLLEFMESTGEDDFVDRINRLRASARSRMVPMQDLCLLGRAIEDVQWWPRELGDAMQRIQASMAREPSESVGLL